MSLLSGPRLQEANKSIASGWKATYFRFRFDEKARKETNLFQRTYQHSLICMDCLAQKPHKGWEPALCYKNMHSSAAHRLAPISYFLDSYFMSKDSIFMVTDVWHTYMFCCDYFHYYYIYIYIRNKTGSPKEKSLACRRPSIHKWPLLTMASKALKITCDLHIRCLLGFKWMGGISKMLFMTRCMSCSLERWGFVCIIHGILDAKKLLWWGDIGQQA